MITLLHGALRKRSQMRALKSLSPIKARLLENAWNHWQLRLVLHSSCLAMWKTLLRLTKRAAALMPDGGSIITLTYGGSTRVMPNYNVMGVAKAALEASVRYLAADYGPQGVRVNAISAGPMRTLAGAGIGDARAMFAFQEKHSPLRRTVALEEVGGAGLYLLSSMSGGVTGEIHYVDAGYNIISMPRTEDLVKA